MAEHLPKPFDSDEMDDDTAALVLKLQYEDIQRMQSSGKGKASEYEVLDSICAIKAFEEELQNMTTTLSDRAMSRSMTRAVITDSALLTETRAKDDAIASDRAFAERVSRGEKTAHVAEKKSVDSALEDVLIARLTALYIPNLEIEPQFGGVGGSDLSLSESSTWAASRTSRSNVNHDCVSCGDRKRDFEVLQAPCNHCYCQDCLRHLFELSMKDETLFPPRCCRKGIPLRSARLYLDKELMQRFDEKSVEFTTPNRIYCSRQMCSAFIPPQNIMKATSTANCSACSTTTCTICKGGCHAGDCAEDTEIQLTLAAAKEQGWQRCNDCGALVELNVGCFHITCRCKAQFCYVCGLRWKTCKCSQWDEDRLIARAHQIAMRDPNADPAVQAVRVQQAADHLLRRHNCDHDEWRTVRGGHDCEECGQDLPYYINECKQCHIQVCNRCKSNRL